MVKELSGTDEFLDALHVQQGTVCVRTEIANGDGNFKHYLVYERGNDTLHGWQCFRMLITFISICAE